MSEAFHGISEGISEGISGSVTPRSPAPQADLLLFQLHLQLDQLSHHPQVRHLAGLPGLYAI